MIRPIVRLAGALALLPLVAASTDPLEGRIAGKPQTCINPSSNVGPEIVDAHTILYRDGARIYRTTIDHCPALRPFATLIVERFGTSLCRHDRFRLIEPPQTIASGYCFFGDFVPYTKIPKTRS
ncbi:hypothetical protein [Sphingomonas sp.]|uniref:hypothetical protein n=1 Tax=Sphingomonas sp. TaxID=28214 RepID=UPI0035BC1C2A